MRTFTVVTAALILLLGIGGGYALAQMGGAQGGMVGPGMMGQDGTMGQRGQGVTMGGWMRSMLHGQPLAKEQIEQFAQQHGMTVEQAKQTTDSCTQAVRASGNSGPAR
jgi:hypothetical protein